MAPPNDSFLVESAVSAASDALAAAAADGGLPLLVVNLAFARAAGALQGGDDRASRVVGAAAARDLLAQFCEGGAELAADVAAVLAETAAAGGAASRQALVLVVDAPVGGLRKFALPEMAEPDYYVLLGATGSFFVTSR